MADDQRRVDPFTAFLVVACLVLAALVVALTFQNRSLKDQLVRAASASAPPQFKAGDVVLPFTVVADSGETKAIAFGQGETKTVLLVFSSTCPACKDTVPAWRKLLGATPPALGVRVLGVQTDRLVANASAPAEVTAAYSFPVYGYKRPNPDPLELIPFIPAAIVVDAKGVVVAAWFGVPGDDDLEALKRQLAG
jgi:peroxiredoxin